MTPASCLHQPAGVTKLHVLGLIFVALCGACAPTVRSASEEAVKAATPALAQSTLSVMEDQAARERLAPIVETPEVQRAMQQLSVGLAKGLMEGLSQHDVDAYVRGLAKDFARHDGLNLPRERHA